MKSRTIPESEITSDEYVLTFGKYKGETVRYVLNTNPGYIEWLDDEKILKFSDEIYQEAQILEDESENWDWGVDPYDFMDGG